MSSADAPPVPSSSDFVLRWRAPSCISERWQLFTQWDAEPARRFWRKVAFVESTLHFMVGAMSAEVHALNLATPGLNTDFWDGVASGRHALGSWANAAYGLSKLLARREDAVLRPLAEVLAPNGIAGEAHAELAAIVKIRNRFAHPASIGAADASAAELDLVGPARTFLAAMRAIDLVPVFVVTDVHTGSGMHRYQVRRVAGVAPSKPFEVALPAVLDRGRPFAVSRSGQLLYLNPLVDWREVTRAGGGTQELRVLRSWKKGQPVYDDPRWEGTPEPEEDAGGGHAAGGEGLRNWLTSLWRTARPELGVEKEILAEMARGETASGNERELTLPGYEGLRRLGAGGNGRVYRAVEAASGDEVAIKVLLAGEVQAEARERLRREAKAMATLGHENIVKYRNYLEDPNEGPVLVMEYLAGSSARRMVAQDRRLPLAEVVRVTDSVLAALEAVHSADIVHRDITPENVMLTPEGEVKVIDFGIARLADLTPLTRTHDGLGKENFAAPEQVRRDQPVGPRADLFACGRLLGFLASGGEVEPRRQAASLPAPLQAVYFRATCPKVEDRFPSAVGMRDALRSAAAVDRQGAPVWAGARLGLGTFVAEGSALSCGEGLWEVPVTIDGVAARALVAERTDDAEGRLLRRATTVRPPLSRQEGSDVPVHWLRLPEGTAGSTPERPEAPPTDAAPSDARPADPAQPPHQAASTPTGKPVDLLSDTTFEPPSPQSTGELARPPDVFGGGLWWLIWLSVPFLWPIALVRLARSGARSRIPSARPPRDEPSYLPVKQELARARLDEVVLALAAYGRISLAHHRLQGGTTFRDGQWAALSQSVWRVAWLALLLPYSPRSLEWRRAAVPRFPRAEALRTLRLIHRLVEQGAERVPPVHHRALRRLFEVMERDAWVGAEGLAAGDVVQWLRDHGVETVELSPEERSRLRMLAYQPLNEGQAVPSGEAAPRVDGGSDKVH